MHGNLLNKNKSKMFLTANSDLAARISILENNVYKVTYYEIISGASGTLTVPTGATINSGEFSGANCVLSEINGSNKPTFVTPLDGGGTPVTSTLNVGTGAWVKSGVTVSTNVALIYSVDITAADYQNLNNFYIIDNVLISSLSQVLTNSGTASTLSSELSRVISDETGSGSLVFGTSPTFVTDITTPLIIGGSAVGSNITYKSTTGTGTTTGIAHNFTGGTNGATTIATLYNNGNINLGNYASPNNLRLVTIGQDTAFMSFGSLIGTTANAALYMNQATPSGTNFTISSNGTSTNINAATGTINLGIAGISRYIFSNQTVTFSPVGAASGAITPFNFTVDVLTGQTASTEIPNFKVTGNTKTWAAGAITTQRWNYLTANTAAFASASTITNSYGLYVEAATAGTNATITNNWALGLNGNIELTGTVQGTASLSLNSSAGNLFLKNYGQTVLSCNTNVIQFSPIARSSGSNSVFDFRPPANTNDTASTEVNGFAYNVVSTIQTWAAGTITTQREAYFKTRTYAFASASTITNAYGLYVEAPTAGTNATITNNYAAGFSGSVRVLSGTSDLIIVERPTVAGTIGFFAGVTPSSTNYSIVMNTSETRINAATTVGLYASTTLVANITSGEITMADAKNFVFNTVIGSKIGTGTGQKLSFWNATPIVQPTTAVTAATLVGGGGTTLTDTDTFDGYTLKQIVKALRNTGLLA